MRRHRLTRESTRAPRGLEPRAAARGVEIARPRPFLKWAGGKGQLLPELLSRVPESFRAYHEPFLGGGALFFELVARGRISGACLSDVNQPLIETFSAIRDDVGAVISHLRRHRNEKAYYYKVRAEDPRRLSPARRAARVIFLNKTCYNGLYRENREGRFNVPFGRYKNPRLCDESNLRAVAEALQAVDLSCGRFSTVLTRARRQDFVYFDPPYQPVSPTSSFTSYDRSGFGEEDQEELRDVFAALAKRGVRVMLSNSDTPLVRRLFGGYPVDRVFAPRSINSRGDRRGKIPELIIRSYGPGEIRKSGLRT